MPKTGIAVASPCRSEAGLCLGDAVFRFQAPAHGTNFSIEVLMRHFFGINVVLFLLALLGPLSVAAQKQTSRKPAASSVSTPEIALKVSEGPAHKVEGHISRDRRTPGA